MQPAFTYLHIRPRDLRAGDVVQRTEPCRYWNDTKTGNILTMWTLIARVDCLLGNVWLAENARTCEQRVIEFKHSEYYAAVYGGCAFTEVAAGRGRLVERGYLYQFMREG